MSDFSTPKLTESPSLVPVPKMQAVGVAGAVTLIVVYVLGFFFHVSIPAEVASAATVLIAFGAGYLKRP